MLGYYSTESKAIGVANSLYSQILSRSTSTVNSEFPEAHEASSDPSTQTSTTPPSTTSDPSPDSEMAPNRKDFLPQYEMMALHVYLTLRRLREESGGAFEADVKIAMQTLFDKFWTDVRYRMMIKEHELTLLQSGKWIKVCEKNFFSMALAFDEALNGSADKMQQCIGKHIKSLRNDSRKIARFHLYMMRERQRLNKIPMEQLWQGQDYWKGEYAN